MQIGIPISVLLKLCCWPSSFPQRLKNWTPLRIKPFLLPSPLQCMNLQKYFSLKIHYNNLASPTHQTFCILCGFQINLLLRIPPHKGKKFQSTTLIWIYFPQMTPQILTIKTLPKCFNQVNKILRWKDTILPIIYFIKYYRGTFGKIWIRKFVYIFFHIFYNSLFACLDLRWQGNINSSSQLTFSVLILGNVSNSLPPFYDPNLKPHATLVLE